MVPGDRAGRPGQLGRLKKHARGHTSLIQPYINLISYYGVEEGLTCRLFAFRGFEGTFLWYSGVTCGLGDL